MRNVPFFEYPRLWADESKELQHIIETTAQRGGYIMQKELTGFERQLAEYTGAQFSIGVGNATDGMEIYLAAIGVKSGDEIIISSHTMLATASAIVMAGGVPVPVDIGYDNLIDPKAVEAAITPNTVGIMPTQLNGRTCDMDAIRDIATKHKLFVVEDAAQALGSTFKNQSAGTFGLASAISFFPAKVLGCLGDAGGILTNDAALYDKCYQLHDHGRDIHGEVKCWGRNSRMDNIQAAILSHKLKDYDKVIQRRRDIASLYQNSLGDMEELKLPPAPDADPNHFDVYQNYELEAKCRDELKAYLADHNIGTLIQWGGQAVHQFEQLGFNVRIPRVEAFFENCLMLPMNIFISDEDIEYICGTIRAFYGQSH